MRASPVYIYFASSQFPSPESRYQLQHVQYALPGFSIAAEDRGGVWWWYDSMEDWQNIWVNISEYIYWSERKNRDGVCGAAWKRDEFSSILPLTIGSAIYDLYS